MSEPGTTLSVQKNAAANLPTPQMGFSDSRRGVGFALCGFSELHASTSRCERDPIGTDTLYEGDERSASRLALWWKSILNGLLEVSFMIYIYIY